MAPTLTDQQQRTDQALSQYLDRWNKMSAAARSGPDGAELRDLIATTAGQRNGDAGRAAAQQALTRDPVVNTTRFLGDLDVAAPRSDGPAGPPPSTPAAGHTRDVILDGTVYNAPPGDGRAWLPGNAGLPSTLAASDKDVLVDRDQAIQRLNESMFGVDPALAWKPSGAELPETGTNISTLGQTHDKSTELLGKFDAAVTALSKSLDDAAAAEPLIAEQRDRVRPALQSLATAVQEAAKSLPPALSAGAIAANDAFHQLRGQNLSLRAEMARRLFHGNGNMPGTPSRGAPSFNPQALAVGVLRDLPAVSAPSRVDGVAAAAADIAKLTQATTAPAPIGKENVPSGNGQGRDGVTSPVVNGGGNGLGAVGGLGDGAGMGAAAGNAQGAGEGKAKSGLNDDEISRLLNQLTPIAAPLAQQAAQIPQQLTAPFAPLAQQAGQIPQQAANALRQAVQNPDALLSRLRGDAPENARLTDAERAAAADTAARDRDAATVAYTPPKPAEAAALGAPGSPARPHQLDATGKPVDRNGDGKVDDNAVPLSKKTVKPFDLSVPADGQNIKVKGVPDPRIGEMMLDMADAKGSQPMSVQDAAKAAGMDIPALGDPMDPKLAKVGDAIVGDAQSGIYLGDGKVLTSTGLVENLDDVVGRDGFAAKIPLPELPDTAPGGEAKHDAVTVSDTTPKHDGAASQPPAAAPAGDSAPTAAVIKTAADIPAAPPAPPAAPITAPPAAPLPPLPADPAPPAPAPAVPPAAPAGGKVPQAVPYEGRALG